jgi:hypothetical protein
MSTETRAHDAEQVADLVEAVEADDRLHPAEKETSITFSWGDDRADVFTAEPALMRRVLAHPYRGDTSVVITDGDRRPTRTPEEHNGEPIVGVNTDLPAGALKIQAEPRSATGHAPIVSRHHYDEVRK